ncbi:hypothetical protein QBC43DRAFT_323523 [Cladorrhinum sp. PSN259]|nr:hypothetical protein QBC43DRAFT_323523 [Cladorrhinum sp. PSN259]
MDLPFRDRQHQLEIHQQQQQQQQQQQPEEGYDSAWDHDTPAPAPIRPSRVTFFQPKPDREDNHSISSVGLGIAQNSPGYRPVQSRDHSPPASKTEYGYQAHDYPYSMATTPETPEFSGYRSQHGTSGTAPQYSQKISTVRPGSRWGWLQAPWVMYALFLAGVVFAAGHHIFYASLDGKPANDQIRMMRFGGLLSYAAKASLVGAVIFGYKQQVWLTVRRKNLQLGTIDSIFSASQDLTALLNWEFIRKAKVSIFLVSVSWLFPLTVILTPSSLTVALMTQEQNDTCHSVRTLNFELEKQKNWRFPDRLNNYPGQSLSMWNCSTASSWNITSPYNDTFFDYWDQPSQPADLLTQRSAISGNVVARDNLAHDICGNGWNCTYSISYQATGYRCTELGRGVNMDDEALKRAGAPDGFNSSKLIPKGDFSYIAHTRLGDYAPEQLDILGDGGSLDPKTAPFPKTFGALQHEPVLWIGHSVRTKPDEPIQETRDPKNPAAFNEAFEPVIFSCELWITNYTVQFNHTLTSQHVDITKREYIRPLIDTKFDTTKNSTGSGKNIIAGPESNFVYPLDADKSAETMRITAAYHSLASLFRKFLHGDIQYINPTTRSEAYKTKLIDTRFHLPVPNLMDQVERFYDNFTLSILSNPQLMIVTWAQNASERSGITESTKEAIENTPTYPCIKSRTINAYVYVKRDLWIAYAVAIALAITCVSLGTSALAQNNFHVRDLKVSSIVAATRAPCLEELPWKSSKWGEVPWEIKQTTLGYGIIRDAGPNGTPALGGGSSRSSMVGSGKVYYGFAPPGVLERTRAATFGPATPRPRNSPFSFKTWDH